MKVHREGEDVVLMIVEILQDLDDDHLAKILSIVLDNEVTVVEDNLFEWEESGV